MTKAEIAKLEKGPDYSGWNLHELHMKAEIIAEGFEYDDSGVAEAICKLERNSDREKRCFDVS